MSDNTAAWIESPYADLRVQAAPMPKTGPDQLLVEVRAVAVNPLDAIIQSNGTVMYGWLQYPVVLGEDVAGVVVETGADVKDFVVGDRVFVRTSREQMGSIADHLAVDARFVAKAPRTMSATEAASIPLVALTTLQGLVDRAGARAGQRILIHAGSGGLGSFAIQYARNVLGLHVTATTSSGNAEWVGALGANVVIAYDREDYRTRPERFDIVFDTLGGSTTSDSFALLNRGGAVVSVAGPPDRQVARQIGAGVLMSAILWLVGLPMAWRASRSGTRYYRFLTESDGEQLASVAEAIDAGKVRAVIDSVYPFGRAIEALQHLAAGRAKGKVVIKVK
jgi:alcohol dehydrogenase